jgi:hypothetical protein
VDKNDALEWLKEQFEHTAEWRREKAQEYPGDVRNLDAARMLDRLAATIEGVPDDLAAAYAELHEDDEDLHRLAELENEMRKGVGFRCYAWENATEFIQDIVAAMTGGVVYGVNA